MPRAPAPRPGATDREHFVGALDVPIDLEVASAGSRGLAYLLDGTIILLGELSLFLAVTLVAGISATDAPDGLLVAAIVGVFAVEWLYFIVWEQVMGGQSPGKRWVGLRVVGADGAQPGIVPSVIRNLLRPVDLLPGSYATGLVSIFVTRRQQRLGDLAAGTLVVVEPRPRRSPVPHRYPEGLDEDGIRLVEAWARRSRRMLPHARDEIARRMWTWLRRDHPAFLAAHAPAGTEPQEALEIALDVHPD